MKLSIQGIKDKEAWEKAGIKLPSYDVEKVATATKEAPVWVHFGIGNIYRWNSRLIIRAGIVR